MERERGGETDGDLTDLKCLGRTEEKCVCVFGGAGMREGEMSYEGLGIYCYAPTATDRW